MTLYETIFARRSVRQYADGVMDAAELEAIRAHVAAAPQLAGQSARFGFVGRDQLKGGMAPHAILAFADENDAAFVNIGFVLQGVDLWLQSHGYGSIWCGMAKPEDKAEGYRILLGFGKTNLPMRGGEGDFKRKKLSDISDTDNAVARAARLAPSAVNFQPWKLAFSPGKVTICANVRGIGRVLPGRLYLFDLGIVAKHVQVALAHEGKTVTGIEVRGKGRDCRIEIEYK